MTSEVKTLLVIGHGYSAGALSNLLYQEGGWRVFGTTRSNNRFAAISEASAKPLLWPGTDISAALREAQYLLVSAAPGENGDPVVSALGSLIAEAEDLRWFGYLSTTAVYGDRSGGWVDETSRLAPTTHRGKLRVAAEAAWQALAEPSGLPLHIFRLAGIYGVGRGPVQQLLDGRRQQVVKPGQVFNRIHVNDIARILRASMADPRPGAIYNVCDDRPAAPQEATAWAARRLGLSEPDQVEFSAARLSPMARSFYSESKRVRNSHVKQELGISLLYPDYKSGFSAVINSIDVQKKS